MWRIENLNAVEFKPLITPHELKDALPLTEEAAQHVFNARQAIRKILAKEDPRMLVIVGPCSIHDPVAALEYAEKLNALRRKVEDRLYIVMRTYFEKPRTTIGWKGLINDPFLDDTYDMHAGLHKARELLVRIAGMGMATATEMLDPIVPQYIADLVSWAAIGARTIESQTHREMASGLSMPVGMKNSTDGNLQIAIDAILSCQRPHRFLGIDDDGRTCIVETRGNQWCHIILRGGRDKPNYDAKSVAATLGHIEKAKLPAIVMVDCSHANSGKHFEWQARVLRDVIAQRTAGNDALIGIMLESNLHEGSQKIPKDLAELNYGVSVTDECLSWEATEILLQFAYDQLGTR